MPDTFADTWRAVRLHAPEAPALLAQNWVLTAYRHLCERRPWSWLRAESEFLTNAQKTGTATATRSSLTVQGVTMTFAATDVGRQFRTSTNSPLYSIAAVDVGLNQATLDRVYGGTTGTYASFILDAYITMPTDFGRFIVVIDTVNGWRLHIWDTDEELNARDPQRSSTGTPFALASRRVSTLTATIRRAQYELWPFQTSARNYPFYYIRRPEKFAPNDALPFLLQDRGDILMLGALAECCDWPGTAERRNPYYNQVLARMKRDQFNHEIDQLEVRDEEVYMTWLQVAGYEHYPYAPIDSNFAQAHDSFGQTWE